MFSELEEDTNYKDILLRHCQQNMQINPTYELISSSGPGHNKTFISVVLIKGIRYEQSTGKNKKSSEQEASKLTLLKLGYKFN